MVGYTAKPSPELTVALLGACALWACAACGLYRWLTRRPSTLDPWGEEVAAEIDKEDALSLCHHCLEPHHSLVDFCANCGAPVGQYTNWLPYPYLFSVGDALRRGTGGDFKHSKFTLIGFILFAIAEYNLLAPIYWIVFLRRFFQRHAGQTETAVQR